MMAYAMHWQYSALGEAGVNAQQPALLHLPPLGGTPQQHYLVGWAVQQHLQDAGQQQHHIQQCGGHHAAAAAAVMPSVALHVCHLPPSSQPLLQLPHPLCPPV